MVAFEVVNINARLRLIVLSDSVLSDFDGDSVLSDGPLCPNCGTESIALITCWYQCRLCKWTGCPSCATALEDGVKEFENISSACDNSSLNVVVERFGPQSLVASAAPCKTNPDQNGMAESTYERDNLRHDG